MRRILSFGLVFVLIFSGLVIVVPNHVAATNPTLTNYGALPIVGDIGAAYLFWCTYTDADNDPPTLMQITRQYLTSPVYNMLKNDTGDTDYTDGCLYYYTWYNLPFIGSNAMRFIYQNAGYGPAFKQIFITQLVAVEIINFGVTPADTSPGTYTFYATYRSRWLSPPGYMKLTLNGIADDMIANDSSTDYRIGKNYSYTTNLSAGLNIYSFNTIDGWYFPYDVSTGDMWIMVRPNTVHISFALIAIIAGIVACFAMLWMVKR